MDNRTAQRNKNLMFRTRPATIHFSTIQYVSRYSCHDTIRDMMLHNNTMPRVLLVGSEVYTADKPSLER